MAPFRAHALSTVALLLTVASKDACPENAGLSHSCRAASWRPASSAHSSKESSTKASIATADLITQEVEQLKSFMQICDERIEALEELKQTMHSGSSLPLPDAHTRVLKEQLPLLSEVTADQDQAPTGSADDYLISKAVISQETPVSFIKFLPLRNPRSGGSSSSSAQQTSLPSVLLVALQSDGTVRLFNAFGELVLSFSAGHEHAVTNLAVSQSQDEYLVMTADAGGVIRLHKINVRQRRLSKDQRQSRRNTTDEKVSQYLGAQVNVTSQFQKQMQVPSGSNGKPPKLTAMAVTQHQGTKYYVVGDEDGTIGVFLKNGSYATGIAASATSGSAVEGLHSHLSNLVVRTGSDWGYVDLGKSLVNHVDCDGFDGKVRHLAFDSQQASRVLVSDQDGTVWVLNLKERKNCKVEHQYPQGATAAPVELGSIKGFTLALERAERNGDAASVLALNNSHIGKRQSLPSAVVWRKGRQAVKDWHVYKRYQAGDLLAFLSEDGHEIELMELLMTVYQAPAQDQFGNFKMPVIAVAIVLVLGYQYMKNKGGGGKLGGGKGGKFDNMDFSSFGKRGGGGSKLGALGKLGAARRGGGGLGGSRFGKR